MRAAKFAVVIGLLSLVACRKEPDAMLVVTVTASGSPQGVVALEVILTGPAGSWPERYTRGDGKLIMFPTTLTATLPARATGEVTIEVRAVDAAGMAVATGHKGPITVRAGARQVEDVRLDCGGDACAADGGVGPGPDGGVSPGNPRCGNGRVDPMETCDIAIARGDPGACPPSDCSDGVACTKDVVIGSACTARCEHEEMVALIPGDGCCPANANRMDDPDCSPTCGDGKVNAGETCDTAIAAGSPGACPTISDCVTGDGCSKDVLSSAGTCSAICLHYPITVRAKAADGCCPPGAIHKNDDDCPVVCGNGFPETEAGEMCDVGIPFPELGSCPTTCKSSDPQIVLFLDDWGCKATCVKFEIKNDVSGDGYCRADGGVTHAVDTDCPARCGNGQLEPGEACDKATSGFGACPTACPPSPSKCLQTTLVGEAGDCSARCVTTTITNCLLAKDGCCPAGCTGNDDGDCSTTCGNGTLETTAPESCDTGVMPGRPGSCPTSCTSANPCTEARLVSAGTCVATCVLLPITAPRAGDGCCPNGANFNIDADCPPLCGNGIVESPAERCDYAAGNGSCPTDCPSAGRCAPVQLVGEAAMCSARCVASPITACVSGDGCCPSGCTAPTDSDCYVICGDGVVGVGESCDRRITAGKPGACARSCDDQDACTVDVAAGSAEACTRTCTHARITACRAGDGCCPAPCTPEADSDCAPSCGDGKLASGETCDPPASCPTTCPDDGDPCTREKLMGDPGQCTAACRHTAITACSGTSTDACCPTGCTATTDSDC